jgi:hypothetical protein
VKRLLPLCALLFALGALHSSAILDTNSNGLSDLWELDFNNQTLFPPNFNPSLDPDGDGWTNAAEAAAGTNPFDPNPPDGLIQPNIVHTPAVFGEPDENGIPIVSNPEAVTVTWPTLIGKQYTLLFSPDLSQESWIPVGAPFIGSGNEFVYGFEIHEPDNRFWRVAVTDIDRDNDGLNDWEEGVLELNPLDSDWDKDGITDGADPTPKANNNDPTTGGDPDGHLMTADVSTGLVAWWDFQTAPTQTSPSPQLVNRFPSRGATGYNLNFTQGIASGCAFAGLGAGNSGTQPGTAEPLVLTAGSPLLGSSSMTVSYWIQLVAGTLTQAQGQPVPSVTLVAYTNQGLYQNSAQEPNFQWKAIRRPGGGTRFSITALTWAGTDIDSTTALDDGRWHHLAFTFYGNGSNGNRIYLDGTELPGNLTGFSFAQIPANAATTGGYLLVGGTKKLPFPTAPSANPVHELKGRIDSLMAHARVLPAETIHDIAYRNRDSDQIIDRIEANTTVWRDNNANGLSNTTADAAETAYLSSPDYWQSPDDDMDGDGATTAAELAAGTDQGDPDSDDDLMPDGFEIAHGLNPNNANDATQDKDGDGLCNLDEYRYGSDPETTNTDGDSAGDLAEVNGPDGDPATDDGSDPADGTDNGARRPAAELVSFNLGVGDRSGSHSEDYVLNVFRVDSSTGEETRIYTLRSGGFGSYTSTTRAFKKGDTYTFQIQWLGSNNHVTATTTGGTTTIEGPDWDYHLVVEPVGTDTGGILLDSYDPATDLVSTTSPLCDTGDTSDDDDNIPDFPRTFQPLRVMFAAVQVEMAAPEAGDGSAATPPQPDHPSLEMALLMGTNRVPPQIKATTGGWLMLNFDDDSNRNNYAHGNTSALPDYAFTGAINGENDLMIVAIRKLPNGSPAVKYRLVYDNTNIRLWKQPDRSDTVVSGQSEFTIAANRNHFVVYAEGIKPHDNDQGTFVTSQFKVGTDSWKDGDKVKLRVAHPIVALYMEGRLWLPDDGKSLADYATEIIAKGPDDKPDPLYRRMLGKGSGANTFLVPGRTESGTDVCYSISGLAGQDAYRMAKLALKTPDTHIAFNGHANWGAGFAFGTHFLSFEEFFWAAGGGLAACYIGGFHEHPALNPVTEIGGFGFANFTAIATWNNLSDPAAQNRLIQGIPMIDVERFPNKENPVIAPGQTFQRHQEPYTSSDGTQTANLFYHYLADPDVDGDGASDKRSILHQPGNSDVPPVAALQYKSILLNQCNSYRNFIESFNHGRVIGTWHFVRNSDITMTYVKGTVEGWPISQIESELEKLEPLTPQTIEHGMFETTNFSLP